jgi:hypothetical protein
MDNMMGKRNSESDRKKEKRTGMIKSYWALEWGSYENARRQTRGHGILVRQVLKFIFTFSNC